MYNHYMQIDKDTKLIARFHTENNGTGLNIYNTYFQTQHINAVYLLFQNSQIKPLVDGIRNLSLVGAITAGFEHDQELPLIIDDLSEASKLAGRVAMVSNRNGKLYGHYQGGEGLLRAVQEKVSLKDRQIVIVGAGTVAKTLLLAIDRLEEKPKEIAVVNRTTVNMNGLKNITHVITKTCSLEDINTISGDVLINATRIGSSAEDIFFTDRLVSTFKCVADVTFGTENTNLIRLAKKQNKIVVSGWDMFTHQAAVVLKEILNHDANIEALRNAVRTGLSQVNHGMLPTKK